MSNGGKIKNKILELLGSDTTLINLMLKSIPADIRLLGNYFGSDEYQQARAKIKDMSTDSYENILLKEKELDKLNSKIHWIFKCIKDGYLLNDLFLDKENEMLADDKIIIILRTIIETVWQFAFYTGKGAYSKKGKNTPMNTKRKYLKTIQAFRYMLNDLALGGEVRMYKEKKEYYDINKDEATIFNINHLGEFLKELEDEIKEVNGNSKKVFSEPYQLGIKYKFYNPKYEGLRIELGKRLRPYNSNTRNSIEILIEFLQNNQVHPAHKTL